MIRRFCRSQIKSARGRDAWQLCPAPTVRVPGPVRSSCVERGVGPLIRLADQLSGPLWCSRKDAPGSGPSVTEFRVSGKAGATEGPPSRIVTGQRAKVPTAAKAEVTLQWRGTLSKTCLTRGRITRKG